MSKRVIYQLKEKNLLMLELDMFSQFLLEVAILLISLITSISLRMYLAFGQPLSEPIRLPTTLLFITTLIWGAVFLLRVNSRTRSLYSRFSVVLVSFCLTAMQYYLLLLAKVPPSRLLLAYMLVLNLGAVVLAPRLAVFVKRIFTHDRLRTTLKQLPVRMYASRVEIWVALGIGLFWGCYIVLMGVAIGGDSFSYIKVAIDTMLSGQFGFHQLPPAWPLLLSVWLFVTPFLGDVSAYTSAVSVVLTFVLFALVLRILTRNTILNLVFIVLLGSQWDFVDMFFYALTEPLYVLLIVGTYYFVLLHRDKARLSYFLIALLLASAASVTRFMGITLVLLVLLYWFLADGAKRSLRRAPSTLLFALLAFAPFLYLLWLDTLAKSGDSTTVPGLVQLEDRQLFIYKLGLNSVFDIGVDFLRSFWSSMNGAPYLVASVAVLIFSFSRLKKNETEEDSSFRKSHGINQAFSLLFVLLTLAAITFSGSVPVTRYWMPILPFIYFSFVQAWDRIFTKIRVTFGELSGMDWLTKGVSALLFGSALIFQVNWSTADVSDSLQAKIDRPLHQSLMGFDVSSTAANFRDFFKDTAGQYDQIDILIIDGDPDGEWVSDPTQGWVWRTAGFGVDNAVARPFLLRGSIFPEEFSDLEFTLFSEDYQVLSYMLADLERQIILSVATKAPLSEQITNVLSRDGRSIDQGFFVIANEELFINNTDADLSLLSTDFVQIREIKPYRIFALANEKP